MAAEIYAGRSWRDAEESASELGIRFDSDGYYWHLYPYFESAKLPSSAGDLIDLYGGREIQGYELSRLRERMVVAENDLQWRDEAWEVVTGWNGSLSPATEIRRAVNKAEMVSIIRRLISLIDHCAERNLRLCVDGD